LYYILENQVILGKFIAEGGFAKVYEGEYLNQKVAIKTFESKASAKENEEIKRECELMAQLSKHENIIKVFGYHFNPYFIVMELMPKGTLFDYLNGNYKGITNEIKFRIIHGIGSGLTYLH